MSRFRHKNAYGNLSHPRDANGRFAPKLSHSVRLSQRSASYNAGARFPIIPGRLTLYTGALFRLERTSTAPGYLSRVTDGLLDGVVARSGNNPKVATAIAGLKGETVTVGGITVQRSAIINAPTVRLSQRSAPAGRSMAASGDQQTANTVTRAPNRKPRAPRQRRAVTAKSSSKAVGGSKVKK